MKCVMVTGGCGFIGSNFVRYLFENPDFNGRVVNVDKLTYAGNAYSLQDIAENYPGRYTFEHSDIADSFGLSRVVMEHEVDAIVHFAAETHVDRSIDNPDQFIQTNVHGTYCLLEVARYFKKQIKVFHHISTDEVYGSLGECGFFTESSNFRPNNPYSATKAASDHLVRAYANTYGIPVTISNCSNNYGPFQFPEKLIPLCILRILGRQKIPVYGSGKNIRDWLFVNDHCSAIWMIMNSGRRGDTYNIGGHCEVENIQLVEHICDIIAREMPHLGDRDSNRGLIEFVKDRPGHDMRYAIDSGKVERELGWKPQETLESGLERTVKWYLAHHDWVEKILTGDYLEWIEEHYNKV